MERDEAQLIAEALALEPLSDDNAERLDQLRAIALGEGLLMDHCPECGIALEGIDITAHALNHWPDYVDQRLHSKDAKARRTAMLRAGARQRLPAPDPESE